MIQRIQTVYLFLAVICCVVFLFVPVLDNQTGLDILLLGIPAIITAIFALAVIFLYKNRVLQLNILKIPLFLCTYMIAFVAFRFVQEDIALGWGSIMIFVANVAIMFASRGIKADEKLVRESDRLR